MWCNVPESTPKTDYVESAKAKFITQFRNKRRINFLLQIFAEEVQELEDAAQDMKLNRYIDTGVGAQLDIIGKHVGQIRASGQSDVDYRPLLKARIQVNRSNGEGNRMIGLAAVLSGGNIELTEIFPHSMEIRTDIDPANPAQYVSLLRKAKAATIGLNLIVTDGGDSFSFAGGGGKGFGEGIFASVI